MIEEQLRLPVSRTISVTRAQAVYRGFLKGWVAVYVRILRGLQRPGLFAFADAGAAGL